MGLLRNLLISMSVRNKPFSPAEFYLLHPTVLVFSVLLTKEDNGEKAQFKTIFGLFFLGLQMSIARLYRSLNFAIGPYPKVTLTVLH